MNEEQQPRQVREMREAMIPPLSWRFIPQAVKGTLIRTVHPTAVRNRMSKLVKAGMPSFLLALYDRLVSSLAAIILHFAINFFPSGCSCVVRFPFTSVVCLFLCIGIVAEPIWTLDNRTTWQWPLQPQMHGYMKRLDALAQHERKQHYEEEDEEEGEDVDASAGGNKKNNSNTNSKKKKNNTKNSPRHKIFSKNDISSTTSSSRVKRQTNQQQQQQQQQYQQQQEEKDEELQTLRKAEQLRQLQLLLQQQAEREEQREEEERVGELKITDANVTQVRQLKAMPTKSKS